MRVPEKYKFIVKLGKALHTYGVPSYKSQIYLSEIAEKKGIKGSFMDTPTWINYTFFEEDDHTYNHVERVPPGELNLGALSRIVEITNNVLNNKLSFSKAKIEIERIQTERLGYRKIIELIAFIASAGAFSIILDGIWASAALAAFNGALIYGITLWSNKSMYIKNILESLVSFLATVITILVAQYVTQINITMTILASIIVFIPGLSITTALEEITSKSLVSGTAKLFDALVSLFKQFFGVVLGLTVMSKFYDVVPNDVMRDIPTWVDYIAVAFLALSLLPVFKVRSKDLIFGVIAGFASYYTTVLMGFSGLMISIFVGTIVAVIASKIFSKITKSPELVFLIPGIIMLVPGSKAFIELSSILIEAAPGYANTGEQILYIFMGIIGGLLFSGSFIEGKNLTKK
jgi:uncharacterized membrane protein YjjP (DUF1212 family)